MTTFTVAVESPDIIGKRMEAFNNLFIANRERIVEGAVINSGMYASLYKKTPKADRQRYGQMAGRNQLVKSILPAGPSSTNLARIPKITNDHILAYTFGSNLPYAKYVEEGKPPMPPNGTYWDRTSTQSSGRAKGWSTPGTGSHFLRDSIRENHERVLKALELNINAIMKQGGVF